MEGAEHNFEKRAEIEKLKPQGIIAGGPGVGKSTFVEKFSTELRVCDMDSSFYRGDASWPTNYIDDIIRNTAAFDLLLISTHPEVVRALRERGFKVTVVCPDENLLHEYTDRLIKRGHSAEKARWLAEMGVRSREENLRNFGDKDIVFLRPPYTYLSDIIESKS